MRLHFVFLALVGLSACASAPSEPEPLPVDPALAAAQAEAEAKAAEEARAEAEEALQECKAVDLLEQVGQPGTALALELPEGSRVIEPGSIVTQDYQPQRINVDLDEEGNIARVWCG